MRVASACCGRHSSFWNSRSCSSRHSLRSRAATPAGSSDWTSLRATSSSLSSGAGSTPAIALSSSEFDAQIAVVVECLDDHQHQRPVARRRRQQLHLRAQVIAQRLIRRGQIGRIEFGVGSVGAPRAAAVLRPGTAFPFAVCLRVGRRIDDSDLGRVGDRVTRQRQEPRAPFGDRSGGGRGSSPSASSDSRNGLLSIARLTSCAKSSEDS